MLQRVTLYLMRPPCGSDASVDADGASICNGIAVTVHTQRLETSLIFVISFGRNAHHERLQDDPSQSYWLRYQQHRFFHGWPKTENRSTCG